MADYVAYFLNGAPEAARLDTLEISHPNMSRTYYLVRNQRDGATFTIQDAEGADVQQPFEWYPFVLRDTAVLQSLEYTLEVILGDLGEILPMEIARIRAADAMDTPPAVVYRAYSSDDLTSPMIGPINLQMHEPSTEARGTSFIARPLSANNSATGATYSFTRFPMLRGTL